MLTVNTILKEIKEVPVNRLEELYQFVHSLIPKAASQDNLRKKILSYGGAFKDMPDKEYSDFQKHIKDVRENSFDRNIEI